MSRLIVEFKQRLAGRGDSEHEQAFVRLAILSIVLLYLLYQGFSHPESASGRVLPLVAVGFIVGAFIVGWLLKSPSHSHPRRALGMLADYGLMTTAMIIAGEQLAWIYVDVYKRQDHAGDLQSTYADADKWTGETLEAEGIRVSIAGRMMAKRIMGKACLLYTSRCV